MSKIGKDLMPEYKVRFSDATVEDRLTKKELLVLMSKHPYPIVDLETTWPFNVEATINKLYSRIAYLIASECTRHCEMSDKNSNKLRKLIAEIVEELREGEDPYDYPKQDED